MGCHEGRPVVSGQDQLRALRGNVLGAGKSRKPDEEDDTESAKELDVDDVLAAAGVRTSAAERTTRPPATKKRLKVPDPVRRPPRGEDVVKMALDLPVDFEKLREAAKASGMAKAHLVLSAVAAHGDEFCRTANSGGALLPFTSKDRARVRWLLELAPAEHELLTKFVADVGPALPQPSNSAVIGLVLSKAAGERD